MAKRGRPTTYSPKVIEVLDATHGDDMGAGTITDICKILNVPYGTVYQWMEDHPDFSEAVMRVRGRADELVVSAMRKRAIGYTIENPVEVVEEEDVFVKASEVYDMEDLADPEEGDEEISVKGTKRKVRRTTQFTHVPADTNAAKFWLSNRQRKDWSERKEIEVSGKWGDLIDEALKEVGNDDD